MQSRRVRRRFKILKMSAFHENSLNVLRASDMSMSGKRRVRMGQFGAPDSIVEVDDDSGDNGAASVPRTAASLLPMSSSHAAVSSTASSAPLPPPMPIRPMMYELDHGGAAERWDLVIQPFGALFDTAALITIPVFQVRRPVTFDLCIEMSEDANRRMRLYCNIPEYLFPQRAYCWSDKQFTQWFADVRAGASHSVGRCIFKRDGDGRLLCIDGQQRITTTMLCVAAIRDAALALMAGYSDENGDGIGSGSGSDSGGNNALVAAAALLQQCVERADKALYTDSGAFTTFANSFVAQTSSSSSSAASSTTLGDFMDEYAALAWPRLLPSATDRVPFFELIAHGPVQCAQQRRSRNRAPLAVSAATRASVQFRAKRAFDAAVGAELRRVDSLSKSSSSSSSASSSSSSLPLSSSSSSLLQCARALQRLLGGALDALTLVRMESLSDLPLPQLFLWLQEKSLFGMGALLFNAAPGVKFAAFDLIRNLLFSTSLDRAPLELDALYIDKWVRPIEGRFVAAHIRAHSATAAAADASDSDANRDALERRIDEFLLGFLEQRQGCGAAPVTDNAVAVAAAANNSKATAAPASNEAESMPPPPPRPTHVRASAAPRYVCAFERQVLQLASTFSHSMTLTANSGILLWARFFSYFEEVCARRGDGAAASAAAVLDDMADACRDIA
jgi:hypothetical protein